MKNIKGFTLVELLVTIAIIGILSTVVLFSITQFINSSKDASVKGHLSILVTAGEVYYNIYDSYIDILSGEDFCSSSVVEEAFSQIPALPDSYCQDDDRGVPCCKAASNAWAACSQEFSDDRIAYCVDSRGVQREICNTSCTDAITACPDDDTGSCE